MKNKLAGIFGILLFLIMLSNPVRAQFSWGLQDVSIALTNSQYGLPFVQFTPIHPGIDLEATLLKKEGSWANHSFSINGGYLYHSVLAHGIYAQGRYQFQIRVKDVIGIDLGAGGGYAHLIYPGESSSYNESTGGFDSETYHKAFLMGSAGLGLSYIKLLKFQPFIRYDMMLMGNLYNQVAMLKLGLRIKL